MTRPHRPKTLGGGRFLVKPIFPGPGLERNLPGSGSSAQKLLARGVGAPENFIQIRWLVQKLRHFFSYTDARTHRRTDAQTFPNEPPTTKGGENFFLPKCVGDVMNNWKPCKISTISLREGLSLKLNIDHGALCTDCLHSEMDSYITCKMFCVNSCCQPIYRKRLSPM
jgi:hypothetical protein